MIANLSAEDQVRALCQLCGFRVYDDSGELPFDDIPIRIELSPKVMLGTDDCSIRAQKIAWDHFCYRSWESALKGISTFTPASS